jgi:ribose transport system ATP-binding protein
VLEQFHSGIKPTQLVEELSVSEQQIVEIAKVVSEECRIIIFDEPTSSLNEEEACQLFKIIGELKKREWAFTISAISCLKFLRSATGLRS